MAIAFDASSAAAAFGTTTATFSQTCTGSNLILFVVAYIVDGDTIVSVTYAGAAMTQINKVNRGDGRFIYLYYKIAPATGANNVVVTGASGNTVHGMAASYTGAQQSGVPDASVTNTAAAATVTGTVTTIADNCWLVGGGSTGGGGLVTAGANTTLRQGATGSGPDTYLLDSNAAQTPAGSFSMTFNDTIGVNLGILVASFAPATGGVVASHLPYLNLLGVGS